MAVNISEVLRERASMTPDAVGLVEGYGDRRRLTWAELDVLIDSGQVIESHDLDEAGLKRSGCCSSGSSPCTSSTS